MVRNHCPQMFVGTSVVRKVADAMQAFKKGVSCCTQRLVVNVLLSDIFLALRV